MEGCVVDAEEDPGEVIHDIGKGLQEDFGIKVWSYQWYMWAHYTARKWTQEKCIICTGERVEWR